MFCTNCGQQLNDNDKFCGNCGAKVELSEQADKPPAISKPQTVKKQKPVAHKQTVSAAPIQQTPSDASPPSASGGTGKKLLSGIVLLGAIAAGIFWYQQNEQEETYYRPPIDTLPQTEATEPAEISAPAAPVDQSELAAAKATYDEAFERYTKLVTTEAGTGDVLQALEDYKQAHIRYMQLRGYSGSKPDNAETGQKPAELDTTGIEGIVSIEKDEPEATPTPELKQVKTAALDVSPIEGVRITADKNALDKPRDFKATNVSAKTLDKLYDQYAQRGLIPLGGFELDSNMTAEDRFRKPVQISFDLNKLDVPSELQADVQLAYLDDNGRLHLMDSQHDGERLYTNVQHNGAFLYVLLGITVAVGNHYGVFDKEIGEYPKGWSDDTYTAMTWKPGNNRFILHYPKAWPMADPQGVKAYQQRLVEIHDNYRFSQAKNRYEAMAIMQDISKNAEYQKIRQTMEDPQWIQEHYLPVRVANVTRSLDLAANYTESRNLRKPGAAGLPWLPDIYIQPTSLGANLYGEARNGWTTRAFMVIDGTKVPDATPDSMSTEQKSQFDALKTTTLHEYFHLIQSAYTFVDRPSQLWFAEATAVQFEAEAGKAYLANHWAGHWDYTQRDNTGFADTLALTEGSEKEVQQHGYDASQFLEFLRDKYYRSNPDEFMPRLLNDYAGIRGGAVKSLANVTSGKLDTLVEDFRNFARRIRLEMTALGNAPALSADKPYYSWASTHPAPLSAPGLRVRIPGNNFIDRLSADARLVLRDSSGFMEHTEVTWSTDRDNWQVLEAGQPVSAALPNIPPGKTFSVLMQRIEGYTEAGATSAAGKGPASTDVYVLLTPTKEPKLTLSKKSLLIEVPSSPLIKAATPPGMEPYIQTVQVSIQTPDDDEPVKVWLNRQNQSFATELPLDQLVKRLTPDKNGVINAKIRFRECAHKGQGVYGPWSPEAEIELPAVQPAGIGQIVWTKPAVPASEMTKYWKKLGGKQALALRIKIKYRNGRPDTIYETDYTVEKGIKMVINDVDIPNIDFVDEYTVLKSTGDARPYTYIIGNTPEWEKLMSGKTLKIKWVTYKYQQDQNVLSIVETLEEPAPKPKPKVGTGGANPFGGVPIPSN